MKTNKEYLLEEIRKETGLSSGGVLDIFEIINDYDWKVFCSQMGDFDCPGERISAKKVLGEKLKSYPEGTWKKIWNLLEEGENEIRKFYCEHFHTMKEEYKEETK